MTWTGNKGRGTSAYDAYARDYDVACAGKLTLRGSADLRYLGGANRHNPEDLLVAALSACHMLWYLHLCAVSGVVVTAYEDNAEGRMQTHADGSGEFTEVTLRPAGHHFGTERRRCRQVPAQGRECDVLHRPLRQLPRAP